MYRGPIFSEEGSKKVLCEGGEGGWEGGDGNSDIREESLNRVRIEMKTCD